MTVGVYENFALALELVGPAVMDEGYPVLVLVPVPAVKYEMELVLWPDGSELDVALNEIEWLPERLELYAGAVPMLLMLVILTEVEGFADRPELYGGAVADSGGMVVTLIEIEGLADGLYEPEVAMVPITELAEYEYGLDDEEMGYGPCGG